MSRSQAANSIVKEIDQLYKLLAVTDDRDFKVVLNKRILNLYDRLRNVARKDEIEEYMVR